MPAMELVSVVIPAYNAVRFLPAAIRSVRAQAHPHIEIIVVDDGSTDGTGDVARSFANVRYVRQANCGIAAARNVGVRLAQGSLLAFLDADDLWTAQKLSLQLNVLREHPEVSFVAGAAEQFFDDGLAGHKQHFPPTGPTPVPGTVLVRTADFRRVGPFNESLRIGEFIDWYSRAIALGLREYRISDVVLRRRIHGNNTTLRRRDSTVDYLTVLKAHLDRKRRAA